jgi:hypothetical protein
MGKEQRKEKMTEHKFKKLDKTTKWGGNVYAYRGLEIHNITSPNATYGEWYAKGEVLCQTLRFCGNTRNDVARRIDIAITEAEKKMWDEIAAIEAIGKV